MALNVAAVDPLGCLFPSPFASGSFSVAGVSSVLKPVEGGNDRVVWRLRRESPVEAGRRWLAVVAPARTEVKAGGKERGRGGDVESVQREGVSTVGLCRKCVVPVKYYGGEKLPHNYWSP